MSTLGDIRNALAAQLEAQLSDVYVFNHATDNPSAPCVMVMPPERIDYQEAFTVGAKRYVIPLQMRVQRVDTEGAENALDELIDDVVDAVLYDPSLNGTVDSTYTVMADTFGIVSQGDEPVYLACELHLDILVTP